MKEKIIELIGELRPYERISENTELIKSGILDSLLIMVLISQLEETFEIQVADEAVTAENFSYVERISRVVETARPV